MALLSFPFAVTLSECEILVNIYSSSNGNRLKNAGWQQATEYSDDKLVNQPQLCSWYGVNYTDEKQHDKEGVTSLYFPHNWLSGHEQKSVWSLLKTTLIQNIVLVENRLTHVAGISSAPGSLRELCLSSNELRVNFPMN